MFPFKGMFQPNDRLPRPNPIPNPNFHHHAQQQPHHIVAAQHQNPPPPPVVAATQWPLNKADYQDLANDQVDWAALAQQWIHMKETCTTDDLLAAPPPPIISSGSGDQSGNIRSSRLHEEKGEAPMEMDRDDDDNGPGNQQPMHHNPFMVSPPTMGSVLPHLNQPPPNWNNNPSATGPPPIWQQAPPPPQATAGQWNKSKSSPGQLVFMFIVPPPLCCHRTRLEHLDQPQHSPRSANPKATEFYGCSREFHRRSHVASASKSFAKSIGNVPKQ